MPRRLYVEAPTFHDVMTVIRQTPYSRIRPRCIPAEHIFPLVNYLVNPGHLPPLNWVRLIGRGRYRGRLGVISRTCSLLIVPEYDVDGTEERVLVPVKLGQISLEHESGLLKVSFSSMDGIVEVVEPRVDVPFMECVRPLVQSQHPDVLEAWKNVWMSTWPEGCSVMVSGEGPMIRGPLSRTDVEDVALIDGKEVPFYTLSRVYAPGDQFIAVFGELCHHIVSVVALHEAGVLSVTTAHAHGNNRSVPGTVHRRVRQEDLLDRAEFGFLLDEPLVSDRLHPIKRKQDQWRRMTVHGSERLLNHDAYVCGGRFKGYRGPLRLVESKYAVVELIGLLQGSKHCRLRRENVVST